MEIAKKRGETYVKNTDFPGLNKLAKWCRCHHSVMRKAIDDSEKLQQYERQYNLKKVKTRPEVLSRDDPEWAATVDDALATLIEYAPAGTRADLNKPEVRDQLFTMEPDALLKLLEDAKEQAEQRAKAKKRA